MVETRKQTAQRVLRTTMDLGDDSPLELALAQANLLDIKKWTSLPDSTIDAMTYKDASGAEK